MVILSLVYINLNDKIYRWNVVIKNVSLTATARTKEDKCIQG